MDAKKLETQEKEKKETIRRRKMISNQWREFAKQEAFKDFMEYIELQDYLAVMAAKGPVNTFTGKEGDESSFDLQKTAPLLQRSVGYDIVRTYVEGHINPEA